MRGASTQAGAPKNTAKPDMAEMWRLVKAAEAPKEEPKKLAVAKEYRTPQQLNAQRQNIRRAREKAQAKSANPRETSLKTASGSKRVLDTVAEFWARKQARLAEGTSSASSSGPT